MSVPQDEASRNKRTAKRILAIGLPVVLLVGTGVGYAYWTGAGAGSGTATAAGSITDAGLSAAVSGLVPGGTVTVPVTVSNPNATTSISLTSVTPGVITSSLSGCTSALSGAAASWTAPATVPVVVAPSGSAAFGTLSVSMANSPSTNQDACKNAVFTVALSAS
ncbi:MAG: hypothetical protein JJD92_06185 [Frankiaceae bacterium]|nr:hypothetical protein [Frankiaceae bacterium]